MKKSLISIIFLLVFFRISSLFADTTFPSESFLGLTDTPASYLGESGNCVAVNGTETALEFAACGGSVSIGGSVTSGTTGSVLFVGAGPVLAQDNTNFFWDDAADRLRAQNINVGGGASAGELRIMEASGSGTNYTAFKAQAQAGDITFTLPAADGSSGQQLTTNGSGTLSWAAAGGSGSPGGVDTNVQVNEGGVFQGYADFTFDTSPGLIVNESGNTTSDVRFEGDTLANLFFLDASADKVLINGTTGLQLLSIQSSVANSETGSGNIAFAYNPDPANYNTQIRNIFSGTSSGHTMAFYLTSAGVEVNPLTLTADNKLLINGTPIISVNTCIKCSSAQTPKGNLELTDTDITDYDSIVMSYLTDRGYNNRIQNTFVGGSAVGNYVRIRVSNGTGSDGAADVVDFRGDQSTLFKGEIEIDGALNHDGSNVGFFGTAPATQQTELTDELTTVTFTSPGTPDYAIQDLTVGGYGFADSNEAQTVLSVIANLQARVNQLETKIVAYGLLVDAD